MNTPKMTGAATKTTLLKNICDLDDDVGITGGAGRILGSDRFMRTLTASSIC